MTDKPTPTTDLLKRCAEIYEWRCTGVLSGEALRDYAKRKWPDRHDTLQMAEHETVTEALALLAKWGQSAQAAEPVAWLGNTTDPQPQRPAMKGSRKMKVFLGGTCNESNWRNRIIPMLEVGFFNPVVDDWTPDCMAEELRQREECDVCLYVITPKMTGVYSVAEVIDDSNKRPARTVFVRLRDDGDEKFTDGQWKSLGAVAQMVERNGGTAFDSLKSAALHINALTPNAEITGG